jgi:hypothetical protein
VQDVEILIGQVWNPSVRRLTQEAWRCYNAGALRGCIVMTWTAVNADIVAKLLWMAEQGDAQAQRFRVDLQQAQRLGLTKDGVNKMKDIEGNLLTKAADFELIDHYTQRDFTRVQEDRNLCAHTSLYPGGEVYEPSEETTRAHLVTALTDLLTNPPVHGAKLLEDFGNHICDPNFVATPEFIQATYFTPLRARARANIVEFTAKHALLEIDMKGRLDDIELTNRMAKALQAFAELDRPLVKAAVAKYMDRFQFEENASQMRAVIRLGTCDFFWENVTPGQLTHLLALMRKATTVNPDAALNEWVTQLFALLPSALLRERLPELEDKFSELTPVQRLAVLGHYATHAGQRPDPYFLDKVIQLMQQVYKFQQGAQAGQLLVGYARHLTLDTLANALQAWQRNEDCYAAYGMPETSVDLFKATEHLGTARVQLFGILWTAVESKGDYSGLRQVLWENDYFSEPGEGREQTSEVGEDSTN